MKKNIISLLLILFFKFSFAQKKGFITTLDANVYTTYFESSKNKLKNFLKSKDIIILSQSERSRNFFVKLYLEKEDFFELDTFLINIGYLSKKEINTVNNANIISKKILEIEYLENSKKSYQDEINNISNKKTTEKNEQRYYSYLDQVWHIDKQIFKLNLDLKAFEQKNIYKAIINLDDDTEDLTSKKVSFVNMPGASFDILFIENPEKNLFAEVYQGFSLRYLFTKGKSYGLFGVMREVNDSKMENDSSRYSEILTFAFGQDFYTRHFGRGKNKFLNLYSGYNIGGLFLTAENRKKLTASMNLFIGLELFKNQYIIIDNKIGYFIPFSYNRNLRGITYNFSFNFVF